MTKQIAENTLFYGDNLPILREYIPDESIDLVYLDPPFNSKRTYNVLFRHESGDESQAQIAAFDDTWHWDQSTAAQYHELVTESPDHVSQMIGAMREFIGTNQMMAYLVMMAARLVELHRVLKPTGSLYLHCDPTASHYLKVIMDAIFGPANFRNDIIWVRSTNPKGSQHKSRKYSPFTDNILFYAKSRNTKLHLQRIKSPLTQEQIEKKYDRNDERGRFTDGPIIRGPSMGARPNLVYEYKGYTPGFAGWRLKKQKLVEIDAAGNLGWSATGKPYRKLRPERDKGKSIGSFWNDISLLNPQSAERLGYPTQKPLALLERIISASSNPGDIVLDPFCGCGTTVAAAQKLDRKWIGIDITHLSIALMKYRVNKMFPEAEFQVKGEPESVQAARYLAEADRFQFEWWALSLVHARPLGASKGSKHGKKGADKGIDGVITFIDEAKGKPKRILVQVKSGKVSSRDIRDLVGTVDREKAHMGVFITLEEPSKPMITEEASAGFYHSPGWAQDYPRIQILTIRELLDGAEVKMPPTGITFKQAQRMKETGPAQKSLFD